MGSFDTDSLPAEEERETASLSPDGAAPADPRARLAAGTVVGGKYRVERVLGAGGMGVVYEATHLGVGERVALKFLSGPSDGTAVARLRREARIAMRLRSEHAARLMDISAAEAGQPYLVMERLHGQNLSEVLRAAGRLAIEDAVDYVLQACEAMAEAHGLGIIHRDLKPSNLFLTRRADGSALIKVLDFGIAKLATGDAAETLTATATTLGSPLYMSPEQIRSAAQVDARTDVWSLGVVLHELVAGVPPFTGESAGAAVAAIAADAPVPLRARRPDAPAALEAIVLRCLEKPPSRRFVDVAALARALQPLAPARARGSVPRLAALLAAGERATPRPADAASSPELLPTGATWSAQLRPARADRRYLALGALAAALLGSAGLLWRASRPLPGAGGAAVANADRPRRRPDPVAATPTIATTLAEAPSPPPPTSITAPSSPPGASMAAPTARASSGPPPPRVRRPAVARAPEPDPAPAPPAAAPKPVTEEPDVEAATADWH